MKLIDADKLKLSLCRECSLYPNECLEKNGECDWNSIAHINMMTPVDAVPVIRCKDCKYWLPHSQFGFDEDNDEFHDYCELLVPDDDYYAITRHAEDFCSRAKDKRK